MLDNNKIKNFWAYFSNLSLLNAVQYTKNQLDDLEKEISENNFEYYFILNNKWNDKFDKYIKGKNKVNDKKNINKINGADEKKDFSLKFAQYLRNIRNLYSHSENSKNEKSKSKYKKSKENLEKFEEECINKIKEIYKNTSDANIFWNFQKKDFRLFTISIFLSKMQYNEFVHFLRDHNKSLNIVTDYFLNLINNSNNQIYKFRFKFYNVKYQNNIYFSIINFLKNIWSLDDEINVAKSKKKTFLKMAITLLNYIYKKNHNLSFSFFKGKKPVTQLLVKVEIQNTKSNDHFMLLNFNNIRKLLMFDFDIKTLIYKQKYNFNPIPRNNKLDNFHSFKNRYKINATLNNRHLLKTVNKILTKRNCTLSQHQFESVFQALNISKKLDLDNSIWANFENSNKEIWTIIKKSINNGTSLKKLLIEFIDSNIETEEDFKNLFLKNSIENNNIQKVKSNDKLLFLDQDTNFDYHGLFDFSSFSELEGLEKSKTNFKKIFIAPIMIFFWKNFKQINDNPVENILNWMTLDEKRNLILNEQELKTIFYKKIPSNRNIVLTTSNKHFPLEKDMEIDLQTMLSTNYDTLNDKLFWEFFKLLKIQVLNKETINQVRKSKEDYLNSKDKYFNEAWKLEENNSEGELSQEKNYIFHSSISKFKTIENLKAFPNKNEYKEWKISSKK